MDRKRLADLCALALVAGATALFGCLDAGMIGVNADGGTLRLKLTYVTGGDRAKAAAVDSVHIAIYDVSADPWTEEPRTFPLIAENGSPPSFNDATGRYFLTKFRINLTQRKTFRVVAFLSENTEGNEYAGERTVSMSPNQEKGVDMVMTAPGIPASGTYNLAVAKSVGADGADSVGIPIVLENADSIGGLQFRLNFDEAIVREVVGIAVDPASRLFLQSSSGDVREIWSGFAAPTDSTAQVVVVDLIDDEGDTLDSPIVPIAPGGDLLLSVIVNLRSGLSSIPETMGVWLDDVHFATPSGDSDIAVTDPRDGVMIIAR